MKRALLSACLSLLSACAGVDHASAPARPALAVPRALAPEGHEAEGIRYAVATQGREASAAAQEIFRHGGNIIDAAVAVSFAISVERPQSTGIGGGGFLLFREASGKTHAIDFRERAPLGATRDMYLGPDGTPVPERSLNGILSVATPGLVAGLLEIHGKWGKLPLTRVMAPAIRAAEQGITVTPSLAGALEKRKAVLARDPAARLIFLRPDGTAFQAGEKIVQKDLARTLRDVARHGRRGFYGGRVARALVDASRAQGGLLAQRDLDVYRVKWREPLAGSFRGYQVYSMPPPSSGGIHVLQVLNMLEQDPLRELGYLSPTAIHRTASALQLAFADRAVHPGDPDFVHVPVKALVAKDYALRRRAEIRDGRARPSSEVRAGKAGREESLETTHFSLIDAEGNAVASTQTVNYLFGSGIVAPGTGVLLNDEMDDFSARPGAPNVFGAVGGEANAIAPGKTPLSSMSPTIVTKDNKPVMAVGAPGGTRIISCVAETILHYLAYGMPAYESVAAVRFHHQWLPDRLDIEAPGPGASVTARLEALGWKVQIAQGAVPCRVELVVREGARLIGVSDPRDSGRSLAD